MSKPSTRALLQEAAREVSSYLERIAEIEGAIGTALANASPSQQNSERSTPVQSARDSGALPHEADAGEYPATEAGCPGCSLVTASLYGIKQENIFLRECVKDAEQRVDSLRLQLEAAERRQQLTQHTQSPSQDRRKQNSEALESATNHEPPGCIAAAYKELTEAPPSETKSDKLVLAYQQAVAVVRNLEGIDEAAQGKHMEPSTAELATALLEAKTWYRELESELEKKEQELQSLRLHNNKLQDRCQALQRGARDLVQERDRLREDLQKLRAASLSTASAQRRAAAHDSASPSVSESQEGAASEQAGVPGERSAQPRVRRVAKGSGRPQGSGDLTEAELKELREAHDELLKKYIKQSMRQQALLHIVQQQQEEQSRSIGLERSARHDSPQPSSASEFAFPATDGTVAVDSAADMPVPKEVRQRAAQYDGDEGLARPASAAPSNFRPDAKSGAVPGKGPLLRPASAPLTARGAEPLWPAADLPPQSTSGDGAGWNLAEGSQPIVIPIQMSSAVRPSECDAVFDGSRSKFCKAKKAAGKHSTHNCRPEQPRPTKKVVRRSKGPTTRQQPCFYS